MKDYYAILEINENASRETIDKVYKLLVKKYHPDLQDASKKAEYENQMKEINEAYDVLTNREKRETYDLELKEYRMNKIMEEIRAKQEQEYASQQQMQQIVYDDNNGYAQQTMHSSFEVSDEEIRRQAQVYYDELYRQYLYYNGYIKEDFKTVAKRYIAVILTILILVGILYALYKIPYFNEMLRDIINSNEILKAIFGRFF